MKKWKREEKMKRNEKWIDNDIGDEGAKAISESLKINTSLTELNLWSDEKIRNEKESKNEKNENEEWIGNHVGDEGAKTISESLKINTSLTELNLGCDEKIINEKEKIEMKRNDE